MRMNELIQFLNRYENDHQSPYAHADVSKDIGYREGVRDALIAVRKWAEESVQ